MVGRAAVALQRGNEYLVDSVVGRERLRVFLLTELFQPGKNVYDQL